MWRNPNSVIHYHAVVRKALQYAVKNELISTNVADKVDRPKKKKYLASFYSKSELSTLFEATKDDPMALVIQLAAYYGLRRSEVLGLRWSSIDFVQNTLSVNHKVTEGKVDGKVTIFTEDKLKTKSSFRTLPLIPCVRELLFAAKERQTEYKALFKCSYCKDYQIAHISKRKANWLLTNGVIPCEDSGKQTRRFKIRLNDVIDYLQKLQNGTLDVSIPSGIFASGAMSKPPREYMDCDELKGQFLADWYNVPDMLTIKQASEISGYVGTSILRWISRGQIKAVLYHERYLISKESLATFLSSKDGQDIVQKSELHRDVIAGFMNEQKNSGMEFTMSL